MTDEARRARPPSAPGPPPVVPVARHGPEADAFEPDRRAGREPHRPDPPLAARLERRIRGVGFKRSEMVSMMTGRALKMKDPWRARVSPPVRLRGFLVGATGRSARSSTMGAGVGRGERAEASRTVRRRVEVSGEELRS